MKWVVVVVAIALSVAVGVGGRKSAALRRFLSTLLGYLPFTSVAINPISFETYRGDARGLEVTAVDLVALALAVSTTDRWKRPWPLLTAAYLGAAMLSAFSAPMPMFAMFGVWKIVRVHRVLATVAQAGQQRDNLAPHVCRGLAVGLIYCAATSLVQRYAYGMMQCPGPFTHQNSLAMACNMAFPFCFALVLAGQGGWLAKAAVAASALSIVLTLSRGGMMLFVVAAIAVFGGSMAKRLTGRKLVVLLLGLFAASAVVIKSFDTIVERFTSAPDASAEARHLFEKAASAMLRDHGGGIGINQFSLVLDRSYADVFGLPDVDRNGIVHNVYWLTAAEMGYLGLVCFVALFTAPMIRALRTAIGEKGLRSDLALGFGVGIAVTLAQGKLEWSLRTTQLSYLLWIVAGLAFSLGTARRPKLVD
ncbi:MAG: O-antigen ligase family protein [Polyangiaceae bacterium]|nr:O-antigen ligase family protein [Polyangiaceae bacterium]